MTNINTKTKQIKFIPLLWRGFITFIFIVFLFLTSVKIGLWGKLPETTELENPETKLASEVYANNGEILGKIFYQENRTNSRFEDIPSYLKEALIATEDERFFNHSGIDGKALVRAVSRLGKDGGGSTITQQLAKNLFHREAISKTNRIIQKFKEWILAIQIEKRYTKDEIILMYFNTVPYGNSYGIKSAAKTYFNKNTKDLKIEEAAVLVGMLKANTTYNPIRNPTKSQKRRNVVLFQMLKNDYLNQNEFDSLKVLPLNTDYNFTDHNTGIATYFRSYLNQWLKAWTKTYLAENGVKYNIYDDGLKIYTTIDPKIQAFAETAVSKHMAILQQQFYEETKQRKRDPWYTENQFGNPVYDPSYPDRMIKRSHRYRNLKKKYSDDDSVNYYLNLPVQTKLFSWSGEIDTVISPLDSLKYTKQILHTGFMSFEPQTGHIKAWVGGINHKYFQYDHVNKKSTRQVGSTFKPLVYARGLDDNKLEPCEIESTGPVIVEYGNGKEWSPSNSSKVPETVTFYEGLQKSINTVTARVMKRLGPNSADIVKQTASKMGIDDSKFQPYPSICLGTMDISVFEMVSAYGTFVNKGTWVEPIFITKIEDKNGNILADFTPKKDEALRKQTAYTICKMLEKVTMAGGTGSRLRRNYKLPNNVSIGGKTGTTQNNSDGWFMGITPNLVSGCWVGAEERNVHFSNTAYGQGANMALPIFGEFMEQVFSDETIYLGRGKFEAPKESFTIELNCQKYDSLQNSQNNPDINEIQDELF
ncbi:MAG: transglycosylase domain-containing protein [Bacteroidia bacterium]|nr:transglycosylase domain-containing protein [Bacteroidia bacterium]